MNRARAFFGVAAGVFLLMLSFHLGAQSVRAQSGPFFRVLNPGNSLVIETGGQIFYLDKSSPPIWRQPSSVPPVPASTLVAGDGVAYIAEDGTVWWPISESAWQSLPLPGSGPVSPQRESFGALKSRYRGAAEPASEAGK